MVRPASVGLRETEDIDVKTLQTLKIVSVIICRSGVGKAFHVLKQKADRALGFLRNGVAIGNGRRRVDAGLAKTAARAGRGDR